VLQRLSGAARMQLSPRALQALCEHSFPGNVRELENILERALAFASGDTIDAQDLALKPVAAAPAATPLPVPPAPSPSEPAAAEPAPAPVADKAPAAGSATPGSLPQELDKVERKLIQEALARTRYNRTQAADLLGLSLRQLRYRMQRLQIHDGD
jgi:two-component system response regulator PilR (NtrC family)